MTVCTEGWQYDGAVTVRVNYHPDQGVGGKGMVTGSKEDYFKHSATEIFDHKD